jgi:hypothetical protein
MKVLSDIQKLWVALCCSKKCVYCKKEFEDGLLNKYPGKNVIINPYVWFRAEYLVHLKTTHGFDPEDIGLFLEKIRKNEEL